MSRRDRGSSHSSGIDGLIPGFSLGILMMIIVMIITGGPVTQGEFVILCDIREVGIQEVESIFIFGKYKDETNTEEECHERFNESHIVVDSKLISVDLFRTDE